MFLRNVTRLQISSQRSQCTFSEIQCSNAPRLKRDKSMMFALTQISKGLDNS